jgi:hypothetical protein
MEVSKDLEVVYELKAYGEIWSNKKSYSFLVFNISGIN